MRVDPHFSDSISAALQRFARRCGFLLLCCRERHDSHKKGIVIYDLDIAILIGVLAVSGPTA